MQTEKTPIISKDKDELKAALEAILFISGEAVISFSLSKYFKYYKRRIR